jgi:hypothetical protein
VKEAIPIAKRRKSFGAIPPRVSSAIRMSREAIQEVKQNTCACPMPMWGQSRSRTGFQTSRCCSCPISSHRLHGRGLLRHQRRRDHRDPGLRASRTVLRSAARCSLAQARSSRSTQSRSASSLLARVVLLDFKKEDVYERIQELTHGRGADACIDAVGTEAEPTASLDSMVDRAKVAVFLGTDRPHVLR